MADPTPDLAALRALAGVARDNPAESWRLRAAADPATILRLFELAELGAAWAEAEEAAKARRLRGPVLRRSDVVEGQYQAVVFNADNADLYEYGPTPAAALRALTAVLAERSEP